MALVKQQVSQHEWVCGFCQDHGRPRPGTHDRCPREITNGGKAGHKTVRCACRQCARRRQPEQVVLL